MKKKYFRLDASVYGNYRKFCKLYKRISTMLADGSFTQLASTTRQRLLKRLQLFYKRLPQVIGKQKLRWAGAALAGVLASSAAMAGYSDLISLNGVEFSTISCPTMVDLDFDGDLDAVVGVESGAIQYLENKNGFFENQLGGDNPFNGISVPDGSPAFGDLDADGDPDLIIGNTSGQIQYFKNTRGNFAELTGADNPFDGIDVGSRANPELHDMDADGDLDLVIGGNDGEIEYYVNNEGAFTLVTGDESLFFGIDVGFTAHPAVVDFDDDGDLDLFVGEYYGTIQYFRNDADTLIEQTGDANPARGIDVSYHASPAVADLDGDGYMDMVSGEYDAATLSYFQIESDSLVERKGTANPFEGFNLSGFAHPAFGDYDNDGRLELLVGRYDSVVFFENEGNGLHQVDDEENPFSDLTFTSFLTTPAFIDVDNDGDLDLVAGNEGGSVQYYINDNGSYDELTGTSNPFDAIALRATVPVPCDYNGDGDHDLFLGLNTGLINYYENVEGVFESRAGMDNPFDGMDFGSSVRPAIKDIDGDGDFDLIVGDDSADDINFVLNDEGVFTELTGSANPFTGMSANVPAPAFYDYNGDGYDDLILGSYSLGLHLAIYTPPGVSISTNNNLETSEWGSTTHLSTFLESKPSADVTLEITSSDLTEGLVDPATLTFTPSDWDEPQLITVYGVDDNINDGGRNFQVSFLPVSNDWEYDSLELAPVTIRNLDDDGPSTLSAVEESVIKVYASDGFITLESGEMIMDRVEVYSITGMLVRSEKIGTAGNYEMSAADNRNGIYFVKVYCHSEVTTTKIVL